MIYARTLSVFLLLFWMASSALAQVKSPFKYNRYWEVGFQIGATVFAGDLTTPEFSGDNTDTNLLEDGAFALQSPGITLGGNVGYRFAPHWTGRASLMFGQFTGTDEGGRNEFDAATGAGRGAEFTSTFGELSVRLEYDFLATNRSFLFRKKVSPYLFGGFGVVYTSPDATVQATQFNDGIASSVPPVNPVDIIFNDAGITPMGLFGAGVRVRITDRMDFRYEVGTRVAFGDELDGIVASGDPSASLEENNDYYYTATVGLNWILGQKDKCPPRYKAKKKFLFF